MQADHCDNCPTNRVNKNSTHSIVIKKHVVKKIFTAGRHTLYNIQMKEETNITELE